MRIEISSGGISGLMSVGNFLSDMKGFDGSINNVISSFKTVENETASLVGGVGNLGGAVEAVATRLTKEESKKNSAEEVLRKTNDFIALAECVDQQVAAIVEINKNAFYLVHPWLRPPAPPRKKGLLQQAWGFLCGAGDAIVDGFTGAWNWTTGQLKKVCDNLVDFYKKHKKIFDTIAVIGLSTLAVVAVVGSGGTALAPLLVDLGFSAGTAGTVSSFIGGVAVVSTIGSGSMSVADIWFDIDDPTFNSIQKAFNVVSATSNITYSVGTVYNSLNHITSAKSYVDGKTVYRDVGELSGKQQIALSEYSQNDFYRNINNSLRGTERATPHNSQLITTIDSALDHASLPSDMTVFRGTSQAILGDYKGLPPEMLIGKNITESAYMSTSTSSIVANGFVDDMFMTIKVPKGAHGLNISSISRLPWEQEVLFARNQELQIISAERIHGILNVVAELINF